MVLQATMALTGNTSLCRFQRNTSLSAQPAIVRQSLLHLPTFQRVSLNFREISLNRRRQAITKDSLLCRAAEGSDEADTGEASPGVEHTELVDEGPTYKVLLRNLRDMLSVGEVEEAKVTALLDDLETETVFLAGRAEELEARAETAESGLETAKDMYTRLNADFDNFRKRSANEKAAVVDRTKGDVVEQLIPLVDSFEQAKAAIKAETDGEKKIDNSYQGLYKQMVDIFKNLGIEAVPGLGTVFDPNFHEAIMREPDDSKPDGTIIQEFRKGFKIGDKLIRPAMVKVSFTEGPAAAAAAAANGNGAEAEPAAATQAAE